MNPRFDATTTTTCGYCGVGCRLEAHRAGGRVSIEPAGDRVSEPLAAEPELAGAD
jgi:predicted molibdopterin-dependent oxidoreductase YjgC